MSPLHSTLYNFIHKKHGIIAILYIFSLKILKGDEILNLVKRAVDEL